MSKSNPKETKMTLTSDQQIVLDLVLNGEMSMSRGIRWALETGQNEFADYLRTF